MPRARPSSELSGQKLRRAVKGCADAKVKEAFKGCKTHSQKKKFREAWEKANSFDFVTTWKAKEMTNRQLDRRSGSWKTEVQ
eukprot:8655039-Alexandrium_andersonii.AAC.1